jgi:PAS domain S-box-containing protein
MNSMAKWIFTWAAGALVVACTITPADALDPFRLNSQYARERWGSEKGFPGGSVSAFAQTPDGYLWIGTDKGLIRFDGLDFRVFEPAIPGLLHMGPVQSLVTDADGNLWVLLQSTKILRYRDGKFEPGRNQAEFGITAMCKRRSGSVLFSSLAYGTLTYDNGGFETLVSSPEGLDKRPHGETDQPSGDPSARFSWAPHFTVHSLAEPDSTVVATAENVDGKIWLGTQDSGLFQIADGKISAIARRLSGRITCLLVLKDGKLWIGTENGVVVWNGARLTQAELPSALRQNKILAMIQDRDSNIWVATSHELLRFNSNGVSLLARQTLGISGSITALFEDREGNLWVGGSRSIALLRDSVFVSYSISHLQSESSGPVYVDGEERTWFAPFDGGLHWLKDGKLGSVTKDGLDRDVIYSVAGRNDELWIGRRRGGLTHLRYTHGTVATKTYTQANGLAQNSVYAVYQSRSGSVWAATVNAGVSEYSKGRFTTYSKANGMASDAVFSIEESQDGTMWFATPDGLNAFSKGEWRVFTTRDGLPSDNVNCLLSDSSGILWIGTASGLAFLRSGHIQKAYAPPLQEEILGIAADDIGNLWIATTNHILSVKRDRLLSNTVAESDLREYGLEDGLIGQQGVKRFRSVVSGPQGRIWFSTSRGLSVVDPSRAGREPPYVNVQIEGFSADGNSLDLQPPIQVPPDTHRLRFSYSGLSLSTPERIQFKYKLDGFDKDWSEPISTRAAVYSNVGWGSYTFRVMASNSAGVWNQSVALPFSIAPTLYQTRAFRILLVASLLLATWALHRWRIHRLKGQEKRLRDVVETIPAMTFTTLADGSCTFVNKRWTEYTGLSVEETSGIGWQRAIHRQDLAHHSEKWRISVATGQLFEDEARFRRAADGEYRWFLVRGVPLRDPHGKIVKWYGTLTDIEDRKRAEQEREKLHQLEDHLAHINRVSTLGEIAASLAHEIKQPIAAAITSANSCVEWLAHEPPNLDRARAAAARIDKYGNRAAEIIDRIRSFYKKSPPQRELVDVNGIIQEMLTLLKGEADRHSVAMRTELTTELPKIMADRVQLQQVFMNLMLNAIEAMKDSGGELTVKSQLQDGQLQFLVTDTGVGLPREKVDQIFSAFFTTKEQGSGMGLAISRSIVESHGGRLWATANDRRGATFHFTLPIQVTESALVI